MEEFLNQLTTAVAAGDWRMLAGMGCILVTWLLRSILGRFVGWFKTDRGGALMAILVGLTGSAAHFLMSKDPWSFQMLTDGFVMAITAAGGFSIFKKLLSPSDKPAEPTA